MSNKEKYKYRIRPGYGTENLLIEFINGVENDSFGSDLFNAIQEINPKVTNKDDLWVNDEMIYSIDSNLGKFQLSVDSWGFAFIIADENQSCVQRIDELLLSNDQFLKLEKSPIEYE